MSIFGNRYDAGSGQGGGQYYIIARVKSIVLGPFRTRPTSNNGANKVPINIPDPDYSGPQDIGKIRYEILYSSLTTSKSEVVSEPAYPLFTFLKQYPVINEIVFIISGPTEKLNDRFTRQQFFYFPPFSVWGNPNHGAFPNLQELAEFRNRYANQGGYSGEATKNPQFPLGNTFKEKLIKNLKPFEGDTILQSRFGQSIRFGSTVPNQIQGTTNTWSNSGDNGDPITIILNEQNITGTGDKFDPIVENINRDGSSIWMTSTQEIILTDLNKFPFRSFGKGLDPQREIVVDSLKPITAPTEIKSSSEIDNKTLRNN